MMACATINPRWCTTEVIAQNARVNADGSIIVLHEENARDFMTSVTEAPQEEQEKIVEAIYEQTQRIILLVRDRLEREKPYELQIKEDVENV